MLHFEQTFLNERKLEANLGKPLASGSILSLHTQKFDHIILKKFWDVLPPKEKEHILCLRSPLLIETFRSVTFKMMRNPNFKSFTHPSNPSKFLFGLLEFEEIANPFYSYELITNLLGCFCILRCNSVSELRNFPNGIESIKDTITDFGVFESENSSLLKVKSKYLDFIIQVLEHHNKDFLHGDKVLLFDDKYEIFFTNLMVPPPHPLYFDCLIRTLGILIENNILKAYYQHEFMQSLQFFEHRSNTAFFYVNEQGYKPLKLRAVISELKISLVVGQKQQKLAKTPQRINSERYGEGSKNDRIEKAGERNNGNSDNLTQGRQKLASKNNGGNVLQDPNVEKNNGGNVIQERQNDEKNNTTNGIQENNATNVKEQNVDKNSTANFIPDKMTDGSTTTNDVQEQNVDKINTANDIQDQNSVTPNLLQHQNVDKNNNTANIPPDQNADQKNSPTDIQNVALTNATPIQDQNVDKNCIQDPKIHSETLIMISNTATLIQDKPVSKTPTLLDKSVTSNPTFEKMTASETFNKATPMEKMFSSVKTSSNSGSLTQNDKANTLQDATAIKYGSSNVEKPKPLVKKRTFEEPEDLEFVRLLLHATNSEFLEELKEEIEASGLGTPNKGKKKLELKSKIKPPDEFFKNSVENISKARNVYAPPMNFMNQIAQDMPMFEFKGDTMSILGRLSPTSYNEYLSGKGEKKM